MKAGGVQEKVVFYMEESRRSFVSNTKTHIYAYDLCDRVPSLWQVRLCIRIFATSRMEIFFSPWPKYCPFGCSINTLGKAHSGQVELQILQCAALAVATAPSMNTCSFIYCSSGNWQSPSLCCQATKKVPASGGKQTNQDTQRRIFTWLVSKMERVLWVYSGSWLLEPASELKGTQEI